MRSLRILNNFRYKCTLYKLFSFQFWFKNSCLYTYKKNWGKMYSNNQILHFYVPIQNTNNQKSTYFVYSTSFYYALFLSDNFNDFGFVLPEKISILVNFCTIMLEELAVHFLQWYKILSSKLSNVEDDILNCGYLIDLCFSFIRAEDWVPGWIVGSKPINCASYNMQKYY